MQEGHTWQGRAGGGVPAASVNIKEAPNSLALGGALQGMEGDACVHAALHQHSSNAFQCLKKNRRHKQESLNNQKQAGTAANTTAIIKEAAEPRAVVASTDWKADKDAP